MRKFVTVLVLLCMSICIPQETNAQLFKKWRKGKKHAKKETTVKDNSSDNNKSNNSTSETDKKTETKERNETKRERRERKKREKRERKERLAKEKEEEKKKKKQTASPTSTTAAPTVGVVRKWADIEFPTTAKKSSYRIDVLAPMYLDELVKNGYVVSNIPEKAQAGINFYKGVQIAADTLKKNGFKIEIYVHDVASLLESTDMILNKRVLDSSDLIIGAVSPQDVAKISAYALRRHINFISMLSSADGGVTDNPYLTLLVPSPKSHCEWIVNDILDKKSKQSKVAVLYITTTTADNDAYRYIYSAFTDSKQYTAVQCNNLPDKKVLEDITNNNAELTLIIPINDLVYVDTLLKHIKKQLAYTKISVYGLPSWTMLPDINKANAYGGLPIYVTTNINYTTNATTAKYIDKTFKREYGGKPQEMVYRSYEALYWYANLLKRYGTIFNKQYADNETAPFTLFEVKPQWDARGNVMYMENKHIYLRKYENGLATMQD